MGDWLINQMIAEMLEDILTVECGNDGAVSHSEMLTINSQAMKFIDGKITFSEYLDAVRVVDSDPYTIII